MQLFINLTLVGLIFCLLHQAGVVSVPAALASPQEGPSVHQLTDVQPDDWAYEALTSLIERYQVVIGYPNNTYQGTRPLTRYEFAAALEAVLNRVLELIRAENDSQNQVLQEDLSTLERLRRDFSLELAVIRGRIDGVEARTADLEVTQFSTTTKLLGQALFALNGGGFEGEELLDATGAVIASDAPQATLIYRVALDLDTSFQGSDLLKIRLDQGSDGFDDNAAGVLEPDFGSVLDYSTKPPQEDLGVSRLYYTFSPLTDLAVTVGPVLSPTDYIDRSQYTSLSFQDFSTQAFAYNYLLFPVPGLGAGAALDWNPNRGSFTLRSVYTALAGNDPDVDSAAVSGVFPPSRFLYPADSLEETSRGLLGTPHQGIVELEYFPVEALAVRLQYSGGTIYDERFDVLGANVELSLGNLGVFGRYGYASYDDTSQGDIHPHYWMVGLTMLDLGQEGDRAGVAVGQPFIASELGDGTQTNIEAYYNFLLNDHVRVTPLIQVVVAPGNQQENGTIFTGTLRTVILF
ncbi:MAG: iron uptake porin [Cyanophyceae cyanobacterium]